jgi:hypothetical protein
MRENIAHNPNGPINELLYDNALFLYPVFIPVTSAFPIRGYREERAAPAAR